MPLIVLTSLSVDTVHLIRQREKSILEYKLAVNN